MTTAGERFAQALGRKDQDALCTLLADPIDFQALTPRRHWQGTTGRQVAEEIILGQWFDAGDDIQELYSVATGQVVDCEHVAYRLRVRTEGRDYLVEQQAY
jgi:ribosomal protein L21E